MKHRTQASQHVFAQQIVSANKTYIEIGANHPQKSNNTYPLEVGDNWKGFSLELNKKKFNDAWNDRTIRQNPIYWADATKFNYSDAVAENNLPNHIGYLSCDIEPASNTFAALVKVITDGVSFDCITFEHDFYSNGENWHELATAFLKKYGYKIAVYDVYAMNKPNRLFETWFVKDHVDFATMSFDQWKNSLFKN